MTGALILATFAVFAVLMYARVLPALLALPLMAVTRALVAGVPRGHLGGVVTSGAASLAVVYAAVIFGALLGRVTLDTGIARALVNLAAEYGGENPFALSLVVCAIVALLFTSLSGLGAIVMVGSVALPILMTVGVPRTIAATLFLMAFALGFIFNIANWTFYTQLFGVSRQLLWHYALLLAAIDAAALIVYAAIAFRRERDYATWAVAADRDDDEADARGVPAWALLTPVLPLVLYYALHLDAVPAFMLSAVYGVLVTRPRDAVRTLVAAAIRGVEDVAPAVLLFMGIGMLLAATKQPEFAAALAPMVGGAWMRSPIAFVAIFGLASPLALYRGPLNPFGVGIAIFTVLLASHAIPAIVLVAAVMAVVQVQNVCDPTNTANVWVANFTGTPIDLITKRTLPYQVAVATAACLAIVLAAPSLFGASPFVSWIAPAYADDLGTFAPPSAVDRLAIDDDGPPLGRVAAAVLARALAGGDGRTVRRSAPRPGSDCSQKRYAAYAIATVSTFALIEGTALDVGIRLEDCGGWIVNEWHDHRVVPHPNAADARALALEGAARVLAWESSEPQRASALFTRGIALAPGDPPSYFFALFKTVDGYMRVYVRAGGPAYAAGLRSGDIVDKLDGRFWWEYGTYQTQARAYDGKPHSFAIQRPGGDLNVQLGAPLDAQAVATEPAAKPSP